MATILKELTVDVAQLNRFAAVVAKQYDKQSRFLKVHLTNEGTPIVVAAGTTVTINARRADETGRSFYGSVNEDGSVNVPITYWMLELDDTVECDISLISDNNEVMLTSTLFQIEVQYAAVGTDEIEEDEDYPVLLQLIQDVEDAKEEVDAAVEEVDRAVAAVEALEERQFYIFDDTRNKKYTAEVRVSNGKPKLVYDEVVEGGN